MLPLKQVYAEGKWHNLPRTYEESANPEFFERYGPANRKEINSILEYGVFSENTVELPPGKIALDTKFHWDIKTNEHDKIEKYKTRIVIRGFLQQYLEHFDKTYAPTAFKESTRLIIYLIYAHGFYQFFFDVKTAFLNAVMQEEIYVKVPPGFPHYDPNKVQYYKLLKALYGTKQAAMLWYKHLCTVLTNIGYQQTPEDPCFWYRTTEFGLSVLSTHVDDIPGCSQDPNERNYILNALGEWVELSNKLLGMHIYMHEDGSAILFNDVYI